MPTVLKGNLAQVMDPPSCTLAPKKTHIVCTLGPSSRTIKAGSVGTFHVVIFAATKHGFN